MYTVMDSKHLKAVHMCWKMVIFAGAFNLSCNMFHEDKETCLSHEYGGHLPLLYLAL